MTKLKVAGEIRKLKGWRKRNKLSQRQTLEWLGEHGVAVSLSALRKWEIGVRRPSEGVGERIEAIVEENPVVRVGRIGRWKEPVAAVVVEKILALRARGMTLREIGERFGITESGVSRICAGNRRGVGKKAA